MSPIVTETQTWLIEAGETEFSLSSELIKQPILKLFMTGARIFFVEHIGRNQNLIKIHLRTTV